MGREPLLALTHTSVPREFLDLKARDLWRDGNGWDLAKITPYISDNTSRLNLLTIVVDTVTGATDRLAWGGSHDGKFTVKSAYEVLTWDPSPRSNTEALFGRIWKAMIPERIRVFFWLVANQSLMTNSERRRRHLCDSSLCQVCKSGEETILHVLRDCPAISGVWCRIVPRSKQSFFFSQSLLEWLYGNLSDTGIHHDVPWLTLFGMTAWWGWKWRWGNVFGVNGKCRDRVRFVKELAKEVSHANSQMGVAEGPSGRVVRLIAWKNPSVGWYKLNTDGASHRNPGLATAGGALLDSEGRWVQGFAVNLGSCSAPLAELWGVYYGLYLAWNKNIQQLELEVDSELVVGFLTTGISDTHPLSFLVRLCYGFFSKDWQVRISHVYREANRLADGLANYAFSQSLGFHWLESCPTSCFSLVLDDIRGTASPRSVRL